MAYLHYEIALCFKHTSKNADFNKRYRISAKTERLFTVQS